MKGGLGYTFFAGLCGAGHNIRTVAQEARPPIFDGITQKYIGNPETKSVCTSSHILKSKWFSAGELMAKGYANLEITHEWGVYTKTIKQCKRVSIASSK